MIDLTRYLDLKDAVIAAGYARDIDWCEDVRPCQAPCLFASQYIWVVLNSGMRAQVAESIAERLYPAIGEGRPVRSEFGHPGKAAAIERCLVEAPEWFAEYQAAGDKLAYLETLPWIGPITKWHLAKNLGHDCAKPDRHLVRIAGSEEAAHAMCARLAEETGDRIAAVDYVIWRAANLGMV